MNARLLLVPALLGALLACGGGSSSGPAAPSKLVYTDPTTGTYQLRKNTALSTATHVVLELWGPAGATGSGVTVAFTLGGSGAVWRNVKTSDAAGTYIANGTTFDLGAGTPILKARLTGATLVATVAEKGLTAPKALDKPLLQVALDLDSAAALNAQATLTPDPAKCQVLLADGTMPAIAITASTLTVQ